VTNLPERQFIVVCKYCRYRFASVIKFSSKVADMDKLTRKSEETCPACRKKAMYDPDDYLVS